LQVSVLCKIFTQVGNRKSISQNNRCSDTNCNRSYVSQKSRASTPH